MARLPWTRGQILMVTILVLATVLLAVGCSATVNAPGTYEVIRVIDGDTIVVMYGGKEEKVRLIGIDTPEMRPRGAKEPVQPQPFAEEATAYTRGRVEGKRVSLELDVQERDRYGRILAYVYADETMLNMELLAAGLARLYTVPPNVAHVEKLRRAQEEGRREQRGFWKETGE